MIDEESWNVNIPKNFEIKPNISSSIFNFNPEIQSRKELSI